MTVSNHTATVNDAAVKAAALALRYSGDTLTDMAKTALTAALPHLAISSAPCSVEVELTDEDIIDLAVSVSIYKERGATGIEYEVISHRSIVAFARRILSAIVTKPVDVAAVRERYSDTKRNLIINRTSTDLENIINGHDPEHSILNNDVWDRLDRMACEIEAHNASIRALSPAEPAQGERWQDIATAPKDLERLFLASFKNGYLEAVHIGGYSHANNEDEDSCWWSDQDDDMICPTHWMPLPAAPTLSAGRTTEGGEA